MEDIKISPDMLDILNKYLYGTSFGNHDTPHPCLGRKVDASEEASTLFEKTFDEALRRGTFVIAISPDELLGNRGDAIDFSDCWEHGRCECDKDCQLVEKKEAVKYTCAACAHIDDCSTADSFPCCPEVTEKQVPTCADCANQDEDLTTVAGSGITLCSDRQIHVPLASPACDWFVQASKNKNEPEQGETLQEKTRTLAETISDLYCQIANLNSQKEALKSANAELLELSQNCPECQEYCEIADAAEEENRILHDHNASLVKDKERMLSEINASHLEPEREREIITNLQKKLQAEAKENEILAGSLRAAEFALGSNKVIIDELIVKNDRLIQTRRKDDEITNDLRDRLIRAEAAYMELVDARSGTATARMVAREIYRTKVIGF